MPKGVVKSKKDEKIWMYKKRQVEKQLGKRASQFTAQDWRRVNFLFQKAKKKYKGRLPKKYTASFRDIVLATYEVKPIEHFHSTGLLPFWSIQTEQTHGRKGVIRVSRSRLEDPNMAFKTKQDYQRFAGAEDIFQGDRLSLLRYINDKYKNYKTLEFGLN